jgi:UDP-N-acetylglucosamine 2-epimerase
MLIALEGAMRNERPDAVLVYGDTNSTLAGALVAAKLRIPIAHVEAGLRSFDRSMPEEINRVVADHLSDHLYCPTVVARDNLAGEGVVQGVHVVGDVMYDVLLRELDAIKGSNPVAERLGVSGRTYVVATIHRPGNTDDPSRFEQIVDGLSRLAAGGMPVIWPVHPRSRPKLIDLRVPSDLHAVPPASYREMVALARDAACVVTDSGGVQKEAYWVATPCVTVRPSTEWLETVELRWNRLVDADADTIEKAVRSATPGDPSLDAYGDGATSYRIDNLIATLAPS